jgi:benzoyl-CoA reductase/2-hydroxyglutaryl-CoA dehydratase subunit BcrC/BadD/HgdB
LKTEVGFFCSYTPLPLIHAAGLTPIRILPMGDVPDQAGTLLHDNLCTHVKRVLDRAMAQDVPELAGLVMMNSCDAMRRLHDAWKVVRPLEHTVLVDLPVGTDERAVSYLAGEFARLLETLAQWSGRRPSIQAILRSSQLYDELADNLHLLAQRTAQGEVAGGWRKLQEFFNLSVALPLLEVLAQVKALPRQTPIQPNQGVPIYLMGNVLCDPQAFEMIESSGLRIVADDVCTGSRQLVPLELSEGSESALLEQLAQKMLSRPPCARTLDAGQPGGLALRVVDAARSVGARGVVVQVMKFCDPYLSRLPAIRQALRQAQIPLLILEGDCNLRSLGQQQTRLAAFAEMLQGVAS